MANALDRQVGGSHYKNFKIQPIEFFMANSLPYHKAAVIKYIMRYDQPTGKGVQDLEKIKHILELITELQSEVLPEPPTDTPGAQVDWVDPYTSDYYTLPDNTPSDVEADIETDGIGES